MKALKLIYDILIGTIGGILGIILLGALWCINTLYTLAEDIARAIANRKS